MQLHVCHPQSLKSYGISPRPMSTHSNVSKVEAFDYTMHMCPPNSNKTGCCALLRRGKAWPLVAYLVHTKGILDVSSDNLSEILSSHNLAVARSSTKSAKIRAIMKMDLVLRCVPTSELEDLEKALVLRDNKYKKKKEAEPAENPDAQDPGAASGTVSVCLQPW